MSKMIIQPNGAYVPIEKEVSPKALHAPVAKAESVQPIVQLSDTASYNGNSAQQNLTQKAEIPLRLSIERDSDSGEWVYKSIDRLTGDVVNQYPREEILNMKRSERYKPGSIIKTKI